MEPSLRSPGEAKRRNLRIRRPEAETTTESSCDLGQVSDFSGLVFSPANWEFRSGGFVPKTHSTGLTLFETSLGIPGFGWVVGTWLGSALFLTGVGEEPLIAQAFLFFPPPHVLLPSLLRCHQPQEAARSCWGSGRAPCPFQAAELERDLGSHGLGLLSCLWR